MLGYLEVDYDEKFYHIGDAPEYSVDEWRKEKFTIGIWANASIWLLDPLREESNMNNISIESCLN